MSVLIDSMDIPKSCSDCPLNHDEMSCVVTGTRWRSDTMILLGFDYTKERLHDCPILEVPSAQPEIIRCKDCKHRTSYWGNCKLLEEKYHQSVLVDDDGFCSMAERRTDGVDR